jgi:hypothetical protein
MSVVLNPMHERPQPGCGDFASNRKYDLKKGKIGCTGFRKQSTSTILYKSRHGIY